MVTRRPRTSRPVATLAPRLERVARHIDAHADEPLTLASLATLAALSPGRLQRAFKAHFGVSPRAYQDGLRLERLRGALRDGHTVAAAGALAGHGSSSRLYSPTRALGMPPGRYRAGGAGETIHYACRRTVLGLLLMAATHRGVCFAQFGTSEAALRRQLSAEFPAATLVPGAEDGSALDAWMRALDAHCAGDAVHPSLPLDLRGTAFQLRVWRFLTGLSNGARISYTDVAAGIGAPRAVRAAASACARNRIAVLVPCHRVLRGDGGLGGYRWGLERKSALLAAEARLEGQSSAP